MVQKRKRMFYNYLFASLLNKNSTYNQSKRQNKKHSYIMHIYATIYIYLQLELYETFTQIQELEGKKKCDTSKTVQYKYVDPNRKIRKYINI